MPRLDMKNIQLIHKAVKLYETHRCLWDPKQKHYFNKISREMIWRQISAEVNIPVPEVKKKLTSLLGSYRREKSRENKSKLRSGTGKVYKSKWFAYSWFNFLSNKNIPSNTADENSDDATEINHDNDKEDFTNIDLQNYINPEEYNESCSYLDSTVETECLDSTNLPNVRSESPESKKVIVAQWAKNKIRKRRLNATTSNRNSSTVDHYTSFGNYVASELRKHDEHLVPHIKKAILDIMFQVDTGQFPFQPSYTCTSGYQNSSPSTDPIGSPLHQKDFTDSLTLPQTMDSDTEDHKAVLLE